MSRTLFFICFFCLFISADVYGSDRVEFSADRVHSLFTFVETIADEQFRPPHIKKLFEQSQLNNSESQKRLESFRGLSKSLGRHLSQDGFPKERMNGVQIRSLVTTQTAFANDLSDLRQRILGLLPYEDLTILMETLAYFEPIFDQLIWRKNQKKLQKFVSTFKAKSAKWKIDDLFVRTAKFYNTSWPAEQKFHVSFYPIPAGANLSSAQSFGAFESVGVIIDSEDLEGKFGVVFHELCHALYAAQSAEVQNSLSNWFLNHPSPYAKLAYQWLNESLATAFGNGLAYAKAKGRLDKEEWYNHEKVNLFAQALYPKVVEYFDAGKSLDQDFVHFAVNSFEQKFPNALSEFEAFMSDLIILTDSEVKASAELRRELRRQFRIQSLSSGSPIDHDFSKKDVRDYFSSTLMLIAHHKNRKQIQGIEKELPGIGKTVKLAPHSGAQFGVFDLAKRKVLLLLVDNPMQVTPAFQWMGKAKYIEKMNTFQELKFEAK